MTSAHGPADDAASHERHRTGQAPDDAPVPVPDGDEIAAFWELARGRAGLGRLSAVVGTGAGASVPPPAWAFGDSPRLADALLDLVLAGTKTATSTALWELTDAGVPTPEPGDLSIVVDGRGHPRALVRTTAVSVVRFADVDAEHARLEGEGEDDRSLASWRVEHERYLRRVAAPSGRTVDGDTPVVLERFEVRYPPQRRARAAVTGD
ncbi:ASCH domain-containing protein [Cellulomonas sp. ATA003]|uniref:ASCH domain-containing protein n=1 Tax=Cellulomonas sp. ATA003 TaxID=3073064 RepID=UPI002872D587|nr:ASCH domain-containing protein [Cellulomonas sp. ATA003]WNB84690.1 ASCH domain-containing protein [Cellulomonas sp. ATA003]